MSYTVTGFVAKMAENHGQSARGPWTAYSAKIMDKDGKELPKWFQFGFDKPACKEGDYIQFAATDKNDKAASVDPNTLKVSKNPPARPQTQQKQGNGQRRQGGAGGGARDAYWEAKDKFDREHREPRIHYQSARKDALELLKILADQDGLPIPKSQGKANVAKRHEEIMKLLDKLTVQLYHDTETLRVLERVADAGTVNVGGDGALPDEEEFSGDEQTADDAGFDDLEDPAFGDEEAFQ